MNTTSPLRRKLAFERLENRVNPSVTVATDYGTLHITGTELDDSVQVTEQFLAPLEGEGGVHVYITSYLDSSGTPTFVYVPASSVPNGVVSFEGRAGNDFFRNFSGLTVNAFGEDGNDTLVGTTEFDGVRDFLDGGPGDDTLYGHSGNDSLSGGPGRDMLFGGDGDDWLDGGVNDGLISGDDELWGGLGADTFVKDTVFVPERGPGSLLATRLVPINNDAPQDFNDAEGDKYFPEPIVRLDRIDEPFRLLRTDFNVL